MKEYWRSCNGSREYSKYRKTMAKNKVQGGGRVMTLNEAQNRRLKP